jgi:hypothetical protein
MEQRAALRREMHELEHQLKELGMEVGEEGQGGGGGGGSRLGLGFTLGHFDARKAGLCPLPKPEPQTPNPKPEIRNPKPETRNSRPKSETLNPKSKRETEGRDLAFRALAIATVLVLTAAAISAYIFHR